MRVENLNELIQANRDLINVGISKEKSMLKLKGWLDLFDSDNPPTDVQIIAKISQLDMGELQVAFDAEKIVFENADVIPEPIM